MKQIENFVDTVYHSVGGNEEEIQELKAEMKNHLLEAVHELIKEGKSEQEAMDIAMERFGGENEIRSVVGQLFKAQKIFAKRVLYIAVTFFVLTSIVCGVLWKTDKGDMNENFTIAQKIVSMFESKEVISDDMKREIDALVQDKNQILNVQLYKMSDVKRISEDGLISNYRKEATPIYQYESSVSAPEWMLIDLGYDLNGSVPYVQMQAKRVFGFIPFVSFIGFALYATLFTIWATINAYHHKRLNLGWIILFVLFNVLGYLVYRLVERKVQLNTIN